MRESVPAAELERLAAEYDRLAEAGGFHYAAQETYRRCAEDLRVLLIDDARAADGVTGVRLHGTD